MREVSADERPMPADIADQSSIDRAGICTLAHISGAGLVMLTPTARKI
jgi:hypothetical protein